MQTPLFEEPPPPAGDNAVKANGAVLKSYLDRIEKMEDEKTVLNEDIKDIYVEVKAAGYDVKVLRKIIARRKRERAAVEAEEQMIELYETAMGLFE